MQWFTVFLYRTWTFHTNAFLTQNKTHNPLSKNVNSTGCTGLLFTIYSQEWNCLFHQLPSAPHSLFKCREDPAYPKWVGLEELKHTGALAGAEAPRCHWRRLSAAGCPSGAAGYKVKEWTKATAQLPLWPSAMLICNRNAPPGHAHVSTCFLGYLQHHIHTHDTELSHTAHACTAHKARELPSSPAAAPHPGSTAARCAHQCMLHGCDNQTSRGRIARNLNFRDGQNIPVSLHLKELVFSDITVIKLQWKPY